MGHFETLCAKIEEARRLEKRQAEQSCRQSMARSLRRLEGFRRSGEVARPTVPLLFIKSYQPDDGADERRCRELLSDVIAKGVLSATEAAKLEGEINARVGLSQAINPPARAINRQGGEKEAHTRRALTDWSTIPAAPGQLL